MDGMLYDMATGPADLYRVTRVDYLTGELQADVRSEWVRSAGRNG
jgi:hypothetical protein